MIYGLFALLLLALVPGCNCGKKEETKTSAQQQAPYRQPMNNNQMDMNNAQMDMDPEMQEGTMMDMSMDMDNAGMEDMDMDIEMNEMSEMQE